MANTAARSHGLAQLGMHVWQNKCQGLGHAVARKVAFSAWARHRSKEKP